MQHIPTHTTLTQTIKTRTNKPKDNVITATVLVNVQPATELLEFTFGMRTWKDGKIETKPDLDM